MKKEISLAGEMFDKLQKQVRNNSTRINDNLGILNSRIDGLDDKIW